MASKGVARKGDKCTGHGCFPPRSNNQASDNVFVNGKGWHREGDSYEPHCCMVCHGGNLKKGSETVFINGKPAGRKTDPVSCGSAVQQCSDNVFSG